MASDRIRYYFEGDSKDFERAARSSEKALDRLHSSASRNFGRITKAAGLATAGVAGVALVIGKKSVDAAIEAEKVSARLNAQLVAIGDSSSKTKGRIDATITSLSKMSGFDDEDLTDSFTTLVRVTGDVDTAMQQLPLVMDLARAKQMDVGKAAEIVGKVLNGNTGILKRYGVEIQKGATVQDALAAAQQKFGGQAEAYGKTTAGSIDKAKTSLENLAETVGTALAPMIPRFVGFLQQAIDFVQAHWPRVRAVIAAGLGWIRDNVGPIASAAFGALKRAASAVVDWVQEHWPTIKRVIKAVVDFVRDNIVPIFQAALGLMLDAGALLLDAVRKAWPTIRAIISVAVDGIKLILKGIKAGIEVFRDVVKALPGVFRTAWNGAKDAVSAAKDGIMVVVGAIERAVRAIGDAANWTIEQLKKLNPFRGSQSGAPLAPGQFTDVPPQLDAGGGVIPGPRGAGDSVPALLSPGEVVLNARQQSMLGPGRVLSVLARTGAPTSGFRFAGGKGPRKRRPHLPPPTRAPVPGELPPRLDVAIAEAELTDPYDDDVAAWQAAVAYWEKVHNRRDLTNAERANVARALRSARDSLQRALDDRAAAIAAPADTGGGGTDTGGGTTTTAPDADLEAQLRQANLRAEVAQRAAALNGAMLDALGIGSGGVTFQTVFPPTAQMAAEAARGVATGLAQTPFRDANRVRLGLA